MAKQLSGAGRGRDARKPSKRGFPRGGYADFAVAVATASLSVYALARGLAIATPGSVLTGATLSAVLMYAARRAWVSARSRWYGQDVEKWAVGRIGKILDRRGQEWRSGMLVRGLGDVDLWVRGRRGTSVVEIKAFRVWRQSVFQLGSREARALEQAQRQLQAVGADRAYVWLPRGRPTLTQRIFGAGKGQVRVLFGSPAAVARKVR